MGAPLAPFQTAAIWQLQAPCPRCRTPLRVYVSYVLRQDYWSWRTRERATLFLRTKILHCDICDQVYDLMTVDDSWQN